MMNKPILFIIAALFGITLLSESYYILEQRQSSIVLQFGEYVDHKTEAGLNFKVPFVQNVLFFNNQIQNLHADTTEVIASDQKTMRVDAFLKYRIKDALQFYKSAKDERGFKSRLAPILDSSLRQVLGGVDFKTLLTHERGRLMIDIKNIVNGQAQSFGVEVVDVRILRADLPDKSRQAVYERMQSERAKEAKEIRAQGAEEAQKIMATAEKDKIVLLATARKKSEILRGEGDAEAIKSFANAFGKDPEFFDFYRTMQAYRKSIDKNSAKMILAPDNDFMKYFESPKNR
jgi:membrane protease subunit HflC